MSGGVDSSVAAGLMLDAGYTCIGATLSLFSGGSRCCSLEDVNDARLVCDHLNIPHYTLNFKEQFKAAVIEPFIATYEAGGTPNPCIRCNSDIKWKALLQRMRELDYDVLVSGHYARIEKQGGRWLLKKGIDAAKDQSYVLYTLSQEQLACTRLPLGGMTKAQVRDYAGAHGFVNARKQDSQDVCFVLNGDYASFLEQWRGRPYPEGDVLDMEGRVIGRHKGYVRYTLGQRKRLGLGNRQGFKKDAKLASYTSSPLYVVAKNPAANTVTLGPEPALLSYTLKAHNINIIACERIDTPLHLTVRTRYQQKEKPATVVQTGEDELDVHFDEPARAVTPGQSVVCYDGDTVVCGGVIA
jgi:tRNA-specific 2-thiouridylase